MRLNRSPRWGLRLAAAVLLAMILPGAAPRSAGTALAQSGADPYIKDTVFDSGVEPNPDTGPMWESQDIWVRTTPDPNYSPLPFPEASPTWVPAPHESPEYRDPKLSRPNYVYVRVRNRGSAPTSGTERLRAYWTKASASLAWPTQWNDYLASDCGASQLFGAEITKPRKNAATATLAERNAYIRAIQDIGSLPALRFPDGVSYWRKQNDVHVLTRSHRNPSFLPWHREMINRYEALLQEANPTVKLLYWDWTTDPENSTGGFNFFTPAFMGASGRGTGGVTAGAPFDGTIFPAGTVVRDLNPSTLTRVNPDATILSRRLYLGGVPSEGFGWTIENRPNHDSAHGYIGGLGNMSDPSRSAQDPFFFLLHTNVDRLWAKWQRDPAVLARLNPATTYDGASGNPAITGSMRPWDGSAGLAPWTAGGDANLKTSLDASVVSPPIYDDAPLVIPVLQPGEAAVIQIPWYPPNPARFACFGGDQNHFCLLARIETSTAAPFGMTTAETADITQNTKNNNNIAWRNISVVDNFPGALRFASNMIRNVFKQPVKTTLLFANTNEIGASFFDYGRITVDLKQKLFDRWKAGGQVGQGIQVVGATTVAITAPDAWLGNITLDPGENHSIDIQFELNRAYQPVEGARLKWRLTQRGTLDDPKGLVGGQLFEVDISKLVLVRPGSVWRYLDDHTTPAPGWTAPGFDDTKWRQGRGTLGFGDTQDTLIRAGPAGALHRTTYFRQTFSVADPTFYRTLLLRLKRDDGAVVYLNGTEIQRVNLPTGALPPETPASRDVDGLEEQVWWPLDITQRLPLLRQGANVIAVEVHQSDKGDTDLSFDLELAANHASTTFAPDVGFRTPQLGALFQSGQPIPVTVEALSSSGAIAKVALFADGKLLGESSAAPFTFTWSGAALGAHRLRAVATDKDSQRTVLDRTISVVENVPPVVTLEPLANGGLFKVGEPVRVAAQASDPAGAVAQVEFYLQDGARFDAPEQLVGRVGAAPYALDLTGLKAGHYMLSARVSDKQGAWSPAAPLHFTVSDTGQSGAASLAFICRY